MDAIQTLLTCLLFDGFGMKIPVPTSTLSHFFVEHDLCNLKIFLFHERQFRMSIQKLCSTLSCNNLCNPNSLRFQRQMLSLCSSCSALQTCSIDFSMVRDSLGWQMILMHYGADPAWIKQSMEDDSNRHVADDANFNACSILLKKGGSGGLTCLSDLKNGTGGHS